MLDIPTYMDGAIIRGRYTIKEYDRDTGELVGEVSGHNQILNRGFERMLQGLFAPDVGDEQGFTNDVVDNIVFGDGSTAVTTDDDRLAGTRIGYLTFTTGNVPDNVSSHTITRNAVLSGDTTGTIREVRAEWGHNRDSRQ